MKKDNASYLLLRLINSQYFFSPNPLPWSKVAQIQLSFWELTSFPNWRKNRLGHGMNREKRNIYFAEAAWLSAQEKWLLSSKDDGPRRISSCNSSSDGNWLRILFRGGDHGEVTHPPQSMQRNSTQTPKSRIGKSICPRLWLRLWRQISGGRISLRNWFLKGATKLRKADLTSNWKGKANYFESKELFNGMQFSPDRRGN